MRRTLIQFDEETYQKLRRTAFEQGRSISSVTREMVAKGLDLPKERKLTNVKQLRSVKAGKSNQDRISPVSVKHDDALAEIEE